MAELLGVVASGMSVVSLAIQVAESIQKLKAFYSLIRDAPTEILLLLDELETLSFILEDIDGSIQGNVFLDPRTKSAVMKAYRLCLSSGKALRSLVMELEEGLARGKKRGGLKVVLKKDKVEEIRKRLESSKATMSLANQCYNNAIQGQKWESHERDMLEIKATMERLSRIKMTVKSNENISSGEVEDTKDEANDYRIAYSPKEMSLSRMARCSQLSKNGYITRQDGMKKLFGMLDVVISATRETTSASMSVSFPTWIHARRCQLCLTQSIQGWDQSFRSYRVVSFDAPVFHYSMAGNVAGLQQLFQTRRASPFEMDPEGRTPLHYAALYARPDVCHFLLDHGADASVPTSWHGKFGQDTRDIIDQRVGSTSSSYIEIQQQALQYYRGRPAYSTPLHLLATIGWVLITSGRRFLAPCDYDSHRSIEDDFYDTVAVLVTRGHSDIFNKDQFGFTTLQTYTGPISTFQMLKQHEEFPRSNLSIGEVHELLHWLFMSHFLMGSCADITQIIPEAVPGGQINKEVAQNFSEDGNTFYPNLLFLISDMWSIKETREETRYLEKVIIELIIAGSELHFVWRRYYSTLLLRIIHSLSSCSRSVRNSKFRSWLHLLIEAGVDLMEFGRIENTLHENNLVSWVLFQDIETTFGLQNWCCFEILEIRIGASPVDFHIELEDLYVSQGTLLKDFWKGVEDSTISHIVETPEMPGAWIED